MVWYPLAPEGFPVFQDNDARKAALKNTLTAHAILGVAWLVMCTFQAWAGATQGDKRRQAHRFVGTWSMVIWIPFLISGFVVTYSDIDPGLKPSDIPALSVPGIICLISLFSCIAGIWAAKVKNYSVHKDLMVFSISISVVPGTARATWYLWQSFSGLHCNILTTGGGVAQQGGTAIAFAVSMALVVSSWVMLDRQSYTHIRCMMAVFMLMVTFCSVDSLRLGLENGYGCPAPMPA